MVQHCIVIALVTKRKIGKIWQALSHLISVCYHYVLKRHVLYLNRRVCTYFQRLRTAMGRSVCGRS